MYKFVFYNTLPQVNVQSGLSRYNRTLIRRRFSKIFFFRYPWFVLYSFCLNYWSLLFRYFFLFKTFYSVPTVFHSMFFFRFKFIC